MPISALDVKTIKLITTTQIITSIYAVVKELIENSLDANADNIEISLVDDGISLIEVKDNGSGISKEDAAYMGLPSYTSKISSFEDLDALQTFGFRGEALSALCVVAEVVIITKTNEDIVGTLYTMSHNGEIIKQEPYHRSTGTTIQVRNLFKQIPVRRQMIINAKKASQAIKLLEALIQSFGICKPNVRIQFRVNSNLLFTKPSFNNIKEAASHVLGRKIISNMEWLEPENIEFTLKLMLPSRKVQDLSDIFHFGLQYIFVNNRPIKHKDLEKVINNLISENFEQESSRKKAVFLVYIILNPIDIDVNLEPNKDTILFKDQDKILDTIDKCIRTFYGLKIMETLAEQNISNDTYSCYEDYTLNSNEEVAKIEWPACKKRKIHAQEKIIGNNIIKEKTVLTNSNDTATNIKLLQDEQQNNNQIYDQQHYQAALTLRNHLQSPNLSDPDSNDAFPAIISSKNNTQEERETLSQLPVVDLGEDFVFIEEKSAGNYTTNENKDRLNETQQKKQFSLEAWSKGHITGLKGGTDINAIVGQSNNSLNNETNKLSVPAKAHIDHKELKFLKHVRLQVSKENPTLTAAQTAKKVTEFWKQLSSEERGYYRDIAQEEEKEYHINKKVEKSVEENKIDAEKNKNRLLQLFEKMRNTKNEKKEKLNMRTIVPWIIDRNKIIKRLDFESEHIIGRLTPNLWIATICEKVWIVDITGLIKGLKVTNIDINKIDGKRIEHLLKQWLLERDDMSVMYSIYEFTKKV